MRAGIRQYLILVLVLASGVVPFAALGTTSIDGLRVRPSPERTRMVFDLAQPTDHRVFMLENPLRLVIDIADAELRVDAAKLNFQNTPIRSIRTARRNSFKPGGGDDVRVVLDLTREVDPHSFVLKPIMQYSDRLVVDLYDVKDEADEPVARKSESSLTEVRDVIISIDAGHGGDDPGAIGADGLYEKDVVFSIASLLHGFFNAEPGFRSKLIREGDYYVALRERTEIARKSQSDIFLSIHADAFKTLAVSGASVYAISRKGATSETARWLAEKENRADLIGGVGSVPLDDKDDLLAGVLLDLSMDYSMDTSLHVGRNILNQLGKVSRLHKKGVEQAAFAVLKSPDIPSLLIEIGYISNPDEARKLAMKSHQQKLARAIFRGVHSAMRERPPDGSWLAWVKQGKAVTHVIESGDTLSEIAYRYRVSFEKLKDSNGLRNDTIYVGQKLIIPSG